MFSSNTSQVADGGYQISRSLRFNAPDNANLDRGFTSSPTNSKIMTFSAWIKRCRPGDYDGVFSANNGVDQIRFQNSDGLHIELNNAAATVTTTQVFRDPSSWYHIVVAFDTTQATASNRVKVYVNGTQVTSFATANYPTQNYDLQLNGSTNQRIGIANNTVLPMAGYMTEIYRIDGQALTPSSFGETNAQTGVWQPKAYSGSYGTNGFYVNFSDNSNTTAATLGKDYSGNGNNWTPNNFSVTAGAGNDSLVDTPTPYGVDTGAGGNVRGNYCTLNPLDQGSSITISNGNLDITTSVGWRSARSTFGITSGKWYWEVAVTSGSQTLIGIATSSASLANYIGSDAFGWSYYSANGNKFNNNSQVSYGSTYTAGDIIGVAFDADNGTLTFYKNNTSQGTAYTGLTSGPYFPSIGIDTSVTAVFNFGQRPFAYTAPSGFQALCTQNLPTPTIGATTATQAGKYFDVVLRNGGGSSGGTYSTTVDMSSGALLWDKPRNSASSNYLVDSVRGISKNLRSNVTNAEATDASWFTNFGSTSFTTGSSDWGTGTTVVDWIWAANGSGSTNTAGSITSTVSANTTSGFSIVTYTGNATANQTIGHGLGAKVDFAIIKSRSAVTSPAWMVWHRSVCSGNGKALALEETNALQGPFVTPMWDSSNTSTQSSTTTFTIGANGTINASGATYVAYFFAAIAGYSAFGSYTGNGSTDGPFVFCGFRPRLVMAKNVSNLGSWIVLDTARDPYNIASATLNWNSSGAESAFNSLDIVSNGFKMRNTNSGFNTNGDTYIFVAFAENPFKYSIAR